MNIKPDRIFPKKVYALMYGDFLRFEKINGTGSEWDEKAHSFWLLWNTPATVIRSIDSGGKLNIAVITHLQKRMKWGIFMTTGPKSWGLHFWFHWHMQEFPDPQDPDFYNPNSERGIYFRLPGYRWDLEEGMIWTGGRVPGAHWD